MATASTDILAIKNDDSLTIAALAGRQVQISLLWLRDNCTCSQCRVEQTGEKRFLISTVPANLGVSSAKISSQTLNVVWDDGHESSYPLASLLGDERRVTDDVVPWSKDFQPARFEYAAFQESADVAIAAMTTILESGAIVLANAPTLSGTLESLAERLGPVRELLFDRIHDVQVNPSGYNVAHTAMALPPHNDFASYTWPPSVQALHMLANECSGGASVIVDGWKVLKELRQEHPEYFKVLCEVPVPFREFDSATETYAVEPIVRCDVDGRITGLRYSNQLMQRVDPTRRDVSLFYRAYRELCVRINDNGNKVRFRLEGGEILIVASHRVLHGREAFRPTSRRHLQDAYFELDNVRNNLFVLKKGGDRND